LRKLHNETATSKIVLSDFAKILDFANQFEEQTFDSREMSSLVAEDQDDGITPQKHFANEAIFVNGLLIFALGYFCPHLLYIFKNHITVSVESLHTRQQFFVIPQRDEDLSMVPNGLLEYG